MDKEFYATLALVRLQRARELLNEAVELLEKGSYKSANNRAFYAMEKAVKALLSMEQIEAATHNGTLKQFNFSFIYQGDGTFMPEDYQKISHCEQIRNASDYDDFYVASKEESKQQVDNTKYIVEKIERYIIKKYGESVGE